MVAVNGYMDEWGLIHFTRNYHKIFGCLSTDDALWGRLSKYIDVHDHKEFLLQYFSSFHHDTTYGQKIMESIESVADTRSEQFYTKTETLRILGSLDKCSGKKSKDKFKGQFQEDSSLHDLPHFIDEHPYIRDLLNLILVDWEKVFKTDGLRTFLSYARSSV